MPLCWGSLWVRPESCCFGTLLVGASGVEGLRRPWRVGGGEVDNRWYPDLGPHVRENVMYLYREGTAVGGELPVTDFAPATWLYVSKVPVPHRNVNPVQGGSEVRDVYYLYGDSRRGIRRFVEENTEFLREYLGCSDDPAELYVDEYTWQMLCEEWVWGGYDGQEGPG